MACYQPKSLTPKLKLKSVSWSCYQSSPSSSAPGRSLCFTSFTCFEPADVCSGYLEQEAAKEKEHSLKLCELCMPNPNYTVWHIRLGNDMVLKT
ncbi:hypothetical protein TNCV_3096021 [Trichonephila clavipes]|nr:hypothetical protein TNCV_3096021 [Trichonephila clavipes]